MNSFVTILAASAVLTASLCAGLAATATPSDSSARAATGQPAASPARSAAWAEPPAKVETACRDAAWPYRLAACAAKAERAPSEAPARKVRVIATGAPPAVLAQR